MELEQKHVGWGFWAWWTALTAIGGLAGYFVAEASGSLLDNDIYSDMLGGSIYGLLFSVSQWIVLRQQFSNSSWWVLAGTLGRAFTKIVGLLLFFFLRMHLDSEILLYFVLFVRSTVFGISQWIVLKQWGTKAGWWVLANTIGWTLGPFLANSFIDPTTTGGTLFGQFLLAAIAGVSTGTAMVFILRQSTPETKEITEVRRYNSIKNGAGYFLIGALVGLIICPVFSMIRLSAYGSLDVVAIILYSPIAGAIAGISGGLLGGYIDNKTRGAIIGAVSLSALLGLVPDLWAGILFKFI